MRFTRWQASRTVLALLALGAGLAAAGPAAAQDTDARLKKVEAEVRALQRQVFPGGDGKYFPPEVVTPSNPGAGSQQPTGTPGVTPMTDVLNRLESIESQLARLTARSEVTDNALSQLQARVDALEAKGAAPAGPEAAPDAGTDAGADQPTGAIPVPDTVDRNLSAMKTPAKPAPAPTSSKPAGKPSAARLAKVQAVAKPDTGNPGDDEYSYGFRLWEAGLYPEAQQQLKLYVDKYPKDPKISYGRNLLGRAYLDDKQPAAAASYFLQNYQADPQGARAPDSLLFLAESMIALKENTKACRALAEFGDNYAALATGRLRDQYDKDRKQAACK
jgi:TolA-binding protein